MSHWFGLPLPEGLTPVRSWGARAILRVEVKHKRVVRKGKLAGYDLEPNTVIELVHDRLQYRGADIDADESQAFLAWLTKTALPGLFAEADRVGLDIDVDREIAIDMGAYHLRANPLRSFGYLYIAAWESNS